MDPTFNAQVRMLFAATDQAHQVAGTGRCSCGEPMPQGRDRHLLNMLASAVAEPDLRPHVVHAKAGTLKSSSDTVATPPDATDPRRKGVRVTGSTYSGPTDCPDCGMGLSSRGSDLICPRLDRMDRTLGNCHRGVCIVACGYEGAA